MKLRLTYFGLAALLLVVLLSACKSNNKLNRGFAGLTTKYNIHFNGNEQYKTALKQMEEDTQNDDYSNHLRLHPIYSLVGKKEPDSKFNGAIDKCKKCVQTKSISNKPKRQAKKITPEYKLWLTRSEYNPYLHNAWLLSGRCQFFNGDFNAADATYHYTARTFWWKPLVQAECHIWRARSQAVQGYHFEAEAELDLAIPQKQFKDLAQLRKNPVFAEWPVRLQREFCLAQAEILLNRPDRRQEAAPYLKFARRSFHTKTQRIRSDFFLAQLLEEGGKFGEAEKQYNRIARRASDYKTQFNARIAAIHAASREQGLALDDDHTLNVKQLKKTERKLNHLRRQARNEEYLDQIYAALADVSMMRKDTLQAIERYELAIEKSTRGGMDKAMAALRMGEITFERADYVKAQKAYSVVMSIIKEDFKDYKHISQLSSVLDELQTHAETVQLQDSLLHLASLDEKELFKVIDNIIKELIKKEKQEAEEKALAEYNDRKSQNADPLAQKEEQPVVGVKDKSWYFYNPTTINAGKSEFQRRWGARKPEDDWRRKNKTETLAFNNDNDNENDNDNDASADSATDSEGQSGLNVQSDLDVQSGQVGQSGPSNLDTVPTFEGSDDPHQRGYYLAQIPRTQEQIDNANQLIEEGLYNEGVIINEKLENFPLAIKTFAEMECRYPESIHRLDAYYAIYLMCMRTGDIEQAEIWKQKLIDAFPESAYGKAVADPNYIANLRAMTQGQDSLYIDTYAKYLRSASDSVHQAYFYVHDTWPLSPLMPKFLFLHALSYVQEGDQQSFQEALEQLTATYPQSDVSPLASLMIKGLHEGRQAQSGGVTRGMMWGASLRQANDSTAIDTTAQFVDNDYVPHLLLLGFKTDSINQNDLLFEVAKFNFENYLTRDFDLEIIDTGGGISVLVISGFDDLDMLLDYHDRMDESQTLMLPEGLYMIDISDPNFRLLLSGKTFEEYFEWVEKTYGDSSPDE